MENLADKISGNSTYISLILIVLIILSSIWSFLSGIFRRKKNIAGRKPKAAVFVRLFIVLYFIFSLISLDDRKVPQGFNIVKLKSDSALFFKKSMSGLSKKNNTVPLVSPEITGNTAPAPPAVTSSPVTSAESSDDPRWSRGKVTAVKNGNTVQVLSGENTYDVKLIMVDVMEGDKLQMYNASDFLSRQVMGKEVFLEKDESEKDIDGALLRYIWLSRPKNISGTEFFRKNCVNSIIVSEGYGKVSVVLPDVEYVKQMAESEKYAREKEMGIWQKPKE